jgi:hypothetical protein
MGRHHQVPLLPLGSCTGQDNRAWPPQRFASVVKDVGPFAPKARALVGEGGEGVAARALGRKSNLVRASRSAAADAPPSLPSPARGRAIAYGGASPIPFFVMAGLVPAIPVSDSGCKPLGRRPGIQDFFLRWEAHGWLGPPGRARGHASPAMTIKKEGGSPKCDSAAVEGEVDIGAGAIFSLPPCGGGRKRQRASGVCVAQFTRSS